MSIGTDRQQQEQSLADLAFWAIWGLLFTLPLLAEPVALAFGWRIFFLGDARIQLVWASLVQFGTGSHSYRGALRELSAGRPGLDTAVVLATTGAYGYSFYHALFLPGTGTYFGETAAALLLVTAGKLAIRAFSH